jgi:hypothetical protein
VALLHTIHYGPFDGRFRFVPELLAFALLAFFMLWAAVTDSRTETIECVRPPGEVATCEVRWISPVLPVHAERFNADAVREVKYRDKTSSKGSDVIGGKTVLVDVRGVETDLGATTVEQARLNTEQLQRFLRGEDGSALRIEVLPRRWKAAVEALFGFLALGFAMTILVRGCRDLGGYRIDVRDDPSEEPGTSADARGKGAYRVQARNGPSEGLRLRVTRTVFGVPLRALEVAVPLDVTDVGIEQGTVSDWFLSRGQAPPKGGRLVLRTAAGAALPVIPELRRGERVHERARIALAKALDLPTSS